MTPWSSAMCESRPVSFFDSPVALTRIQLNHANATIVRRQTRVRSRIGKRIAVAASSEGGVFLRIIRFFKTLTMQLVLGHRQLNRTAADLRISPNKLLIAPTDQTCSVMAAVERILGTHRERSIMSSQLPPFGISARAARSCSRVLPRAYRRTWR